ncbi:MAG: tetratricopeptide repeat protein [Oscillospiraceae bacterium]|nr:tetratricopeptide repeat protein [Oscillospiraceae bacterium]
MAFPKSKILTTQKLIQMFRESEKKDKRFCFILGSGASVESDIPSGNILEMDWMNCLLGLKDDRGTPPMDPDATRELAKNLFEEKEIKHTFEEMEAAFQKAKNEGRNSLSSEYYFDLYKLRFHPDPQDGYRYLEALMERKEPSPGYRALALLLTKTNRHNLVITTNFDNLTEDALFLHTDYRPLVISHEALAEYIQFNTRRPIIVKVHRGLMYDPFNSPKTTDHLEKEWHKALEYAFQTYTPVVVGYGGGDESLMSFLKETNFPNGIYWCYREASGEPGEEIKNFLVDKKGFLVKTLGFDALMYTIGSSLYADEVALVNTQEYLEDQCRKRTETYFTKVKKVEKEISEQTGAAPFAATHKKEEEASTVEQHLTYWDHFNRAYEASKKGDHDTAIQEYTLAIAKDPTKPIAYNNRGISYRNLKQYEQAIQDYNKAIELDPNCAEAYNNRGVSYHNMEQHEQAIEDYCKAIELDPNFAEAYNNRGNVYYHLEQYEQAIEDYTKAIELNPNYVLAYRNRALSYRKLEKFDLAEADEVKARELA